MSETRERTLDRSAVRTIRPMTAALSACAPWLVLGTLVVVFLFGGATAAFASVGVGTDMRSIEVTQPLLAGGTYQIHPFTIINTGSQNSGFAILVSATSKPGLKVPPAWLSFKPSTFYLTPNQGIDVAPTLRVPADATPGKYQVLLLGVPKLPGDLTPGGHVNVGVGPRLAFTVVQPNLWQRGWFLFLGWMPWSGLAAVVVLVIALALVWMAVWRRRIRVAAESATVESQDAAAWQSEADFE